MTGSDICTQILQELAIYGETDPPSPGDLSLVETKVNRMLDRWNVKGQAVYATVFNSYTLVNGLSPHTIGPTGATFTVPQRPVTILGANIVLNNQTPTVRTRVHIRDAHWWLRQSVQGISTSLPTDLYYEADWPNGSLFLWPVPTTAYLLELETWTVLSAITLTGTFSLPPGYWDAIVLTGAEQIARSFPSAQVSPTLSIDAAAARADVFGNNVVTPKLATRDSGMPGANRKRGDFNWLNGGIQ